MYKARIRKDISCHKHPKFNPSIHGPGAVKGGCVLCTWLVEIYGRTDWLEHEIGRFSDAKAKLIQRDGGVE